MSGKLDKGLRYETGLIVAQAAPSADFLRAESSLQIRFARPTHQLDNVVAFYRDGLGLPVIGHFEKHAGYSGVMLGIPDHRMHLEFTQNDSGSPCPAPTKDNLLVLYISSAEAFRSAVNRLEERGHSAVESENPFWREHGKTFEDPDGWRVVLYHGTAIDGHCDTR